MFCLLPMKTILQQKIRSGIQVVVGGHLVAAGISTYIGNEKWYQNVVMPTFRLLNPETAHWLSVKCAKYGIIPHMRTTQYESLVRCWCL